nr:5656_t:CDS:2 [Entrophospora candida]
MYLVHESVNTDKDQFGIVGVQIAGNEINLNVLVRDKVKFDDLSKCKISQIFGDLGDEIIVSQSICILFLVQIITQDPNFLSNSASLFTLRDARSLKANFRSATEAKKVIPDRNERRDLDIDQLSQNNHVKTFIYKLHKVVENSGIDIGTSEAITDTLVAHLIFLAVDFNQWPLMVELHPTLKFFVSNAVISAKAEFIINYKGYTVLIVDDKHLVNVRPGNDYGEPQILAEMLASGQENILQAQENHDVIIFVVRVISTYVTFYHAIIHKRYWDELGAGCPRQQSVTIFRWPGNSSKPSAGFDLAEPVGRRNVLESLCKIRHYILE